MMKKKQCAWVCTPTTKAFHDVYKSHQLQGSDELQMESRKLKRVAVFSFLMLVLFSPEKADDPYMITKGLLLSQRYGTVRVPIICRTDTYHLYRAKPNIPSTHIAHYGQRSIYSNKVPQAIAYGDRNPMSSSAGRRKTLASPFMSSPRRSDDPSALSTSIDAPLRDNVTMFSSSIDSFISFLTEFYVLGSSMMINLKACFSRHSQWPPESFRLAGLESLCCSTLPWMSEIDTQIYSDLLILAFSFVVMSLLGASKSNLFAVLGEMFWFVSMMTNSRLVSQNIRSSRLRAFALPGLRACAA
ncbi:hypothetical protein C4D60_Mb08t26220 [Musa balbisiana]|uniref:Uncharacterized protein n=1 Tax=Musa balbisiana TaxID=52838 RepID=A0A4S8K6L7_MUSBA|nr:hypothetical protein C4D60_Mb08t26220 [Musa balbisiana]